MRLRKVVEEAAGRLRNHVRVKDWDRDDRVGFEDPRAQRILLLQLGNPPKHVQLLVVRYRTRPASPAAFDDLGARKPEFDVVWLGPLPLTTEEDRERLGRLLEHIDQRGDLIDFGDPFLRTFLDALQADPRDIERARGFVRDAVWHAISRLRDDVANSSVTFPFGTVKLGRARGYMSALGMVPDFVRIDLSAQPVGDAMGWFEVNTTSYVPGMYVSPAERTRIFAEYFEEGRRLVANTGRWEFIAPGATATGEMREGLAIIQKNGRPDLEPSKSFVQWLNRGLRTRPFAEFITPLDDSSWRSVYEGRAAVSDPIAMFESAISREPTKFENYKALADEHARAGNHAKANVALGLGYLRARGLTGLARGKLDLAAAADPNCPGLAEARRELDAALTAEGGKKE